MPAAAGLEAEAVAVEELEPPADQRIQSVIHPLPHVQHGGKCYSAIHIRTRNGCI